MRKGGDTKMQEHGIAYEGVWHCPYCGQELYINEQEKDDSKILHIGVQVCDKTGVESIDIDCLCVGCKRDISMTVL